jgi:hypothetical protein
MSVMDAFTWILVLSSIALLFWFSWFGRISDDQAKAFIENGALIIDVRTSARYSQKQLEGTVNFPIGSVVQSIQSLVQEKPSVVRHK